MKVIVVYELHWGNTASVAKAIADGFGPEARALTTDEASPAAVADADLIIAGAPVMAFSLPSDRMLATLAGDAKAPVPPTCRTPPCAPGSTTCRPGTDVRPSSRPGCVGRQAGRRVPSRKSSRRLVSSGSESRDGSSSRVRTVRFAKANWNGPTSGEPSSRRRSPPEGRGEDRRCPMNTISNRLATGATVLAGIAASAGLLVPRLYVDAPNWVQQARGTDLATLFLAVPVLVIGLWAAGRGPPLGDRRSSPGSSIWSTTTRSSPSRWP